MFKKFIAAAVVLSLLLGASIFFSPDWTVGRMRTAIETRDYQMFSSYVDYPALRESFKQQLASSGGGLDPAPDPFLALGQGAARLLGGPLVDLLLGPAALIEMFNAGDPEITRAVLSGAIAKVPAQAGAVPEMALHYRDWNTVVYRKAHANPGDGSFVFRRQGWWRWRLAAVESGRD